MSTYAQIEIVSDINQGTSGSFQKDFFEFKGELYFSALISEPFTNTTEEYKLWKTDGTIDGTSQLEAIPLSDYFFPTKNYIFYFNGQNIVKTDGNTTEVITIDFNILEYIVGAYGDYFYFTGAADPQNSNDSALFRTDGTTTTLLMTFTSSEDLEASDNEKNIYKFDDNKIIIYLTTDTLGREPYITDGTPSGTMLLKNITQDNDDTPSTEFHPVNNFSIFKLNKKHLWTSDGTENGTLKIKEFTGSSFLTIDFLTLFNSKIYFGFNKQLWETDGTEAGTSMVFDDIDSDGRIVGIVNRGNDLLILTQYGIHIFDGNSNTTTRLNTPNIAGIYAQNQYGKAGNNVFFNVEDTESNSKLWVTDGTDAGTKPLHNIWPDNGLPQTFETINGKLIFSSGSYSGNYDIGELWVSDGTETETKLLKDINKTGNLSSTPKFQTVLNDKIYFAADDNINGRELFVFDGNTTSLLKDINPGIQSSTPHDFYVLNNKIIFKAKTANDGLELWITDGTEAGTIMLKDINPTGSGFLNDNRKHVRLGHFKIFKNEFYFYANNGTNGMELWKTNGTEAGTFMIKDINSGANSSYRPALDLRPRFIEHDDKLYFSVSSGGSDNSLSDAKMWETDGTEAGTILANDINDVIKNGTLKPLTYFSFNNNLYFIGRDKTSNLYELFRTDVTNGIVKISGLGTLNYFYPLKDRIYFSNNDNNGAGMELWALEKDDTFAIYKDFTDGSHNSSPSNIFEFKEYLYFNIRNESNEIELYRIGDTTEPEKLLSKDNLEASVRFDGYFEFLTYNNNIFVFTSQYNTSEYTTEIKMYQFSNTTTAENLQFSINNKINYKDLAGGFSKYSTLLNNKFYFTGNIDNKGEEFLSVGLTTLSIEDVQAKSATNFTFNLFPNPVIDILNLTSNATIKTGIIYNLLGKKIDTFSTNTLNVSRYRSGLYILKIEDEFGNITSKKWIKK
jgi:ELWxxDGT repeat protein